KIGDLQNPSTPTVWGLENTLNTTGLQLIETLCAIQANFLAINPHKI
ncbi:MAG: hypothetical protein IPN94_13605, partial [Sphingobacteriales bacterium]|nr:hypothetical protein [Sphingobacteriales bacterium]